MIRDQGESMKKEIIEQRSNKKQGGGGQAACEQPEGGRASQAEGRTRAEPQRKQKSVEQQLAPQTVNDGKELRQEARLGSGSGLVMRYNSFVAEMEKSLKSFE